MSIKKEPEEWAKEALRILDSNVQRINTSELIAQHGYDMSKEAEKIVKIYSI